MAVLVYKDKEERFELGEAAATIGRKDTNTICIDDKGISREHCVISRSGKRYFIKDLGSTNGTFVNDQRVTSETELRSGNVLRIGRHVELTFEGEQAQGKEGGVKPSEPSRAALRVIARALDGRLMRGYTGDFDRSRPFFHITPAGEAHGSQAPKVHFKDLKAVFFVRDFEGKIAGRELPPPREDRRFSIEKAVRVEFVDGEVVIGKTLTYEESDKVHGFFIIPVDPTGNNERIFVVNSSVKRITPLEDTKDSPAKPSRPGSAKSSRPSAKRIDVSGLTKEAEDYIKKLETMGR